MRGGAEIGPRHVDVCCHVHTTRAGPCEGCGRITVWCREGRARMQLQFLDMLLNLLFYSWPLSCYFYYSALRADDGAAAFL